MRDLTELSTIPCVLVVEDEALIRLALSDFLEQSGFKVLEAGSGDEAAALLDAGAEVDIVLTDVRMPGYLDGFLLAHWVHEHCPGVPVFLTSGDIGSVDRKNVLAPGEPFIQKPYSFDEVARLMHQTAPVNSKHVCFH